MIIGANSAIARAIAEELSEEGTRFILAGRDAAGLTFSRELVVAAGGEVVAALPFEANDLKSHSELIQGAAKLLGEIDLLLIAHGILPDQTVCEGSSEETLKTVDVNFRSVISLLTEAADVFVKQAAGTVAVVTSVAGDRGRRSNYVYGAAKAGVSAFLEGYRCRMFEFGVNVLDIRPGFVDSPMTADYRKVPVLWASPKKVARGVKRALRRGQSVVYLPWFWGWVMLLIRLMPRSIFQRLKL